MMAKKAIKIELNQNDDALLYVEKMLERNKTIQKRAKVIYYASKSAQSIKDLSEITGINRDYIHRTLDGYAEKGIDYIYECSRGKKKSRLHTIESERICAIIPRLLNKNGKVTRFLQVYFKTCVNLF